MIKAQSTGGWRENLIDIEPYIPGEQLTSPGLIKLNTNENPYPPSPQVKTAIRQFDTDVLRLYPSSDGSELRKALSDYAGFAPENLFLGNGSDEVLAFAFRAFFNSDKPVLFPDITYSFYPVWCRLFGIPFEEIPLDEMFHIRAYNYDRPNGGLVIANPNAPTGIGEGPEFIEYLLNTNRDSIVIIDEAYVDFGGYSSARLITKYENLLVTRSFSKSRSLAGQRIGYAVGSPELIAKLEAVKDSFNSYTLDRLTVSIGIAALRDEDYFRTQAERIMRTRYKAMKLLRGMGFFMWESVANFLFVTHETISAEELYHYLKENDILVRHWNKPRIENYLRISIGSEPEMDVLIQKIAAFMGI